MNFRGIALAALLAAPNPAITPGAIRSSDLAEICAPGYTSKNGIWKKQRTTYAAYGIPYAKRHAYEDDDLYPRELGGDARDKRNHWLQPLHQAFKKNRLENYETRLACKHYRATGDRDATPYQRVFSNWAEEYRRVYEIDP